jgi:hypothetical protein
MDLLIDKLLLFAFCTILYVSNEQGTYTVVLLISVIIFATLVNIIDREYFTLAVFLAAVLAGSSFRARFFSCRSLYMTL